MQINDFTILIQKLRKSRGLTLRTLGSELNMSATYLFDLENGNRRPTENIVNRLVEFYQLDDSGKRVIYDAAASATGLLPYDVVKFLKENPDVLAKVKEELFKRNQEIDERQNSQLHI